MRKTPFFFFLVTVTLLSLQVGCAKRVPPVSGAVELQGEERNSEDSRLARQADSKAEGQEASGLSESNPATFKEEIRDEQIVSSETSRAEIENASSAETLSKKLGDIFFEYNMAVLKGTSEEILRFNAKTLLRHPRSIVRLSGHTDARGSSEYNLALGERRARTVKKFLMAFGLAPTRMEIISYGEEKPTCSDQYESCWKKNRRVHFSVKSEK